MDNTQISAFKGRIKGQTIDPILDQTCTSFDLLDTYRSYRLVVNLGIIKRASKKNLLPKMNRMGTIFAIIIRLKTLMNKDPDGPV